MIVRTIRQAVCHVCYFDEADAPKCWACGGKRITEVETDDQADMITTFELSADLDDIRIHTERTDRLKAFLKEYFQD